MIRVKFWIFYYFLNKYWISVNLQKVDSEYKLLIKHQSLRCSIQQKDNNTNWTSADRFIQQEIRNFKMSDQVRRPYSCKMTHNKCLRLKYVYIFDATFVKIEKNISHFVIERGIFGQWSKKKIKYLLLYIFIKERKSVFPLVNSVRLITEIIGISAIYVNNNNKQFIPLLK